MPNHWFIKNGTVVDGTGRAPFVGHVHIRDGRIIAVGPCDQPSDACVIDATSKIVCPGFIDIHSHADLTILDREAKSLRIPQGVTAEVVGNCGFSVAPSSERHQSLLAAHIRPIIGEGKRQNGYPSFAAYVAALKEAPLSHHIGALVGLGAIRIAVMGYEHGPVTLDKMDHMKHLIGESIDAGALGMSVGLMYAPEHSFTKRELISLCAVAAEKDVPVTMHLRGEGALLVSSVQEAIDIARQADVSLQISHIKSAGRKNWGKTAQKAMDVIEEAIAHGVRIRCDAYPYEAGMTTLASVFPPDLFAGDENGAISRLMCTSYAESIKRQMQHESDAWDNLVASTGWDAVIISSVTKDSLRAYVGKSVQALADEHAMDATDFAIRLLIEDQAQTGIIFFHMDPSDVDRFVLWDRSMIASDSIHNPTGASHPRMYGTHAKFIKKYVLDTAKLSMERAVYKCTGMPAEVFGLYKKGRLVEHADADVVLFDPETLADRATYQTPILQPEGILQVLIGGQPVFGSLAGRVIQKNVGGFLYRKDRAEALG